MTLVRTSPEECDRLGQEVAQKVCAAKGPTRVLVPTLGFGRLSAPGGLLADAEADAAFVASLRNWVYGVEIVEVELNAADGRFAEVALGELTKLVQLK